MTDKGSHGSGHPSETETPFVAWGAGIKYWKNIGKKQHHNKTVMISQTSVPRFDMNQADVTPLISALLSLAVPKNNCGILPRQYLNASMNYITRQAWKNAEQLYQQQKTLAAADFHSNEMETKLDSYIQTTLEAIEYYQTYFKYELFTAFSLSMLGWILIVIGHVMNIQSMYKEITRAFKFKTLLILCAIYGYNFLQNNPLHVTVFFMLPVLLWTPVFANFKKYSIVINRKTVVQTVLFVGCIELCVISFFERKMSCERRPFYCLSDFLQQFSTSYFSIVPCGRKRFEQPHPTDTGSAMLGIYKL
ncbi:hypothetical protein pipiens_013933 [Culex pipiens pipiens]|uniref:GPI ethanolamine phosphate transferase 1 n=1 Tax=Culex pipiens pipiens TaxID=38569 RepID=A0ABD1CWH0_CULPP